VLAGVECVERPLLEGIQREATSGLEPLPEVVGRAQRSLPWRQGVVAGVVSAGVVSAGAAAVSVVGTVVTGTVVSGALVVTGAGDDPRSLFGRNTQMSTAVTTTMATDDNTAIVSSRRFRGALYVPRRLGGLIASGTFRSGSMPRRTRT
jgi:hypothetical protein